MRKFIQLLTIAMALIAMASASEAKTAKRKPVVEAETFAEETMEPAKLVVDPTVAGPTLPGESLEAAVPVAAGSATVSAQPAAPVIPKAELNKLPENEIPVLAQAKDAKKSDSSGLARLMATLGVLVVLLGGVSFGLKRWMSKSKGQNKNTRIKVLTQHHLGPKKSLAIVQVAGESLLIGVTDQNISMLKTLSLIDDDIPEAVPTNFNQAMNNFDDDQEDAQIEAQATEEDFTISGLAEIRDTVSTRSRNMRRN